MKQAFKMEELVSGHEAIMDKYDPQKKLPWWLMNGVAGMMWNPAPTLHSCFNKIPCGMHVLAELRLNIFNNHCDRVRMANLAQMVNVLQAVILTDKEKIILTPTYHVMEMYNVHQNALMIPLSLENIFYNEGQGQPACTFRVSFA